MEFFQVINTFDNRYKEFFNNNNLPDFVFVFHKETILGFTT